MEAHYNFTDTTFLNLITSCELSPDEFTHTAHIRLAWICIEIHGLEKAIDIVEDLLRKYVSFVGAQEKFHITLTRASVYIIALYKDQAKATNWKMFVNEFPELLNDFKSIFNQYYSFDVITSEIAKKVFIAPDLKSF